MCYVRARYHAGLKAEVCELTRVDKRFPCTIQAARAVYT